METKSSGNTKMKNVKIYSNRKTTLVQKLPTTVTRLFFRHEIFISYTCVEHTKVIYTNIFLQYIHLIGGVRT